LVVWRLLAAGQEVLPSGAVGPSEDKVVPVSSEAAPSTDVPPGAPRVGVVAGHAGYDTGAVCPDGLSEAEVNLTVAQEVAGLLTRKGYYVDLLDEYDDRLTGYRADALVSVHADSCDVPGATGFKVARVTDSAIPEAEDRLVACLYQEYQAVTGLPRHPSSITDDMTSYHAFSEIDYYTPGAIIETGFLLDDGDLLTNRPKQVARGIAAGVVCFLEGSQ
jgi:N-acetylmuramoyl-L-alanine amidase